ncbi:MAG: EpsD family peptidyl-prolyl cis-trans isomerase [Burkholderiaceae bacterium]|nr:EpsD family peptidyl-prolyl cis-trans isomerase [Burkholderiaceae bacterium]
MIPAPRRLAGPRRAAAAPPLALVLAAALLAGCGGGGAGKASQTAARVNKAEITVHQINFVLQQQRGITPEQADAAGAQVLQRLVDQELAVQQAGELRLDRDPRVLQMLEAARREVLARAYAERVGEAATPPTADDVQAYYDANPALFARRRVYSLQELAIEATPEQVQQLRAKVGELRSVDAIVAYLRGASIRFTASQAVRPAEQLPLASVQAFAAMQPGQAVLNATPRGAQLVIVADARDQPVGPEQARPAIEQYLLNQRRRDALTQDLARLRAAAAIEYVGKFADTAPAAAAAPDGTASAAPAPAAAGTLDPSDISKGLGIKR